MQNIFNIMSGNWAVLEFSSSLPPSSQWLRSAHTVSFVLADSEVGLCFFFVVFFCLFVPYFPFSVLSSVSVDLPRYPLSPLVSLVHPPRVDNSPSVWGLMSGPSTMVHLWGLHALQATAERVDIWNITDLFFIFYSASLKQQMTATDCAKFPLPLSASPNFCI